MFCGRNYFNVLQCFKCGKNCLLVQEKKFSQICEYSVVIHFTSNNKPRTALFKRKVKVDFCFNFYLLFFFPQFFFQKHFFLNSFCPFYKTFHNVNVVLGKVSHSFRFYICWKGNILLHLYLPLSTLTFIKKIIFRKENS